MSSPHLWSSGLLFLTICVSLPRASFAASQSQHLQNAHDAITVMNQKWYNAGNGQWSNNWWQSANILTTLGDLGAIDSSYHNTAVNLLQSSFAAAKASNSGSFINNFYDDEGWWAMALINAYDLTNNAQYLYEAQDIFQDMTTGAGATCGGIWWSKDKTHNNAIANELYFAVAASLANRVVSDDGIVPDYGSIAVAQAQWLLNSSMRNDSNTYVDGLTIPGCQPEGTVWSYNQGGILGGLVELSRATGDTNYLAAANEIAHGAIASLVDDHGILTDASRYPSSDPTAAMFKGVFARNLGVLHRAQGSSAGYDSFLRANADSIWSFARTNDGQLSANWQGPINTLCASSQGSALDCLVAAAQVS